MESVVFASKDVGNARAGLSVAKKFSERGWDVRYVLDKEGKAWDMYQRDARFRNEFKAENIHVCPLDLIPEEVDGSAYVVTLSASGFPNAEFELCQAGWHRKRPVYGIEDFPGGRMNPGWNEGDPSPLRTVRRIFSVVPTAQDAVSPVLVTVVGPPQLERYRGKDARILGMAAREKLEIPLTAPLVYYSGHPCEENPHVVSRLGEALHMLHRRGGVSDLVLVVSRHSRDRGIPDNGPAHRHALRLIEQCGIRVVENSCDHTDLPLHHPDAIPVEFIPTTLATYQELVCACEHRGVVVTGFGTDGAVVAPFLRIPSILYLGNESFLLGGLLEREKGMSQLPLPVVPQPRTVEDLYWHLVHCVKNLEEREKHCQQLRRYYPFPARDPSDTIVDAIIADLELGCARQPNV